MIRTIKIAPDASEVSVMGNEITTDWNGGICYKADGIEKYKDEYLVDVFCSAVFMSSHKGHLERILNEFLNVNGKVS